MTDNQIEQAVARATSFLKKTSYFLELGLETASADARMCAHAVLELAGELAAERSARASIQAQRDAALDRILGNEPGPLTPIEAPCAV